MVTLIIFILVLSLLVFVHEMGHFLTARKFGVKCSEFGFGYPPRAFGIYKNQEGKWKFGWGKKEIKDAQSTIYSVNWIPLGGFVKIKGENGDKKEDKNSFAGKKIWKRGAILSAGVGMNIVLAIILLSITLMIGAPRSLDGLKYADNDEMVSDRSIQIVNVVEDTPAKEAGFVMGDIIIDIDGQGFEKYKEIQDYVDENAGKELVYHIKREGEEIEIKAVPTSIEGSERAGIGVMISEIGTVKYPWYLAIVEGFKTTFYILWMIIVGLFTIIKSLLMGNGPGMEVSGPVGIATMTGSAARMGIVYLMQFTAMLSLNLAIINFLPIPALDGGRILFLLIEKIKGKPVKETTEAMLHNIGFILLMLLILVVTFKDISNLGCLSCKITELANNIMK